MRPTILTLLILTGALACRPTPGEPSYPDYDDGGTIDDGGLPGDDPWDGESPRLSFGGLFYEGGATDEIIVDNAEVNYYIYENSFFQQDSEERVEGFVSDQLIIQNESAGFWGGGIHFDGTPPKDLTQWTTLHVALRSSDAELEDFQLGMVGQDSGSNDVEGRVDVVDYGFEADGEWHVLNIPLDDLSPPVPRDRVTVGLLLISATTRNNAAVLIDDLYFTAASE